MLSSNIQDANTVQDLLKIFDKYVLPAEFALGLQKLSQLAATENSDALHIYAQSDDSRNRMESLLISFVSYPSERDEISSFLQLGKFSDHEILTAISFVGKYYPEDNEFTDRFSLALSSRLRRINVHQVKIPFLRSEKFSFEKCCSRLFVS